MFRNRPPFRQRLAGFLVGRNGPDTIYNVCIWSSLVLAVLGMFWDSLLCSLLYLGLFGYAIFRFFSRNVAKRRAENQAFRNFFGRFRRNSKMRKKQKADKEHVYKVCPLCKAQLRLPYRKGEHTVCCPRCKGEFSVKIR
ncbi:MAG: hypothetical protein IKK06_05225 [Clostridia bacterium]|nr:hypothetical protein [Clostridia bacterium]